MKNPSRILAIAASVLVVTPLIAGPPTRATEDTFTLTVTPSRSLLDWGLGVIRESETTGVYNMTFVSGFDDLIGIERDGPPTFDPYVTEVTIAQPNGVGNFGYFIIGRYMPEAPPGSETGVTVGMNPTTATAYIDAPLGTEWNVPFSAVLEADVFSDLGGGWGTSGTAFNNSFLGQLFAVATQSANAIGSVGGPTSLNLTLVTFSEADQGGSALLSFNPIPESSTIASGLGFAGLAGWVAWRRSRKVA